MLLTAILMVLLAPQSMNTVKADTNSSAIAAISENSASDSLVSQPLPSAPKSSVRTNAFVGHPQEASRQRKLWYALSFTGAGAASLDAWSTRRAITRGYGVEGNPMLRPFSHSGTLYAATQVSPLVMDFIGKRMMTSQHPLLRKVWWLPQALGSSVSVSAAIHNIRMVP